MDVRGSALPRASSPPGPPHLDMQLVLEFHGLEEVAGNNSFLQRKERQVGIAWQGDNLLLEGATELIFTLP